MKAQRLNRRSVRTRQDTHHGDRGQEWDNGGVPEYPDVVVYVEQVAARTVGHTLERVEVRHPFLLRTAVPSAEAFAGRTVTDVRRVGKRVVLGFDGLFAVVHLMIAGRLHWLEPGAHLHKTRTMCAFVFPHGMLQLTEAGKKRRASLHLVDENGLAQLDPGGLDPFELDAVEFAERTRARNHTLKRILTDPRIFSGIGNAYSDEILHHARLSPVQMSTRLDDEELIRLYESVRSVLRDWTARLRAEAVDAFPERVTAFREEMAVHGRYRQPCPRCGDPVQRIVYASRETNYCATCQTGGRVLADRALSRLLGKDWPRTLEELEQRRGG
jgi:formamidopyrimidine-DNA glycosylase